MLKLFTAELARVGGWAVSGCRWVTCLFRSGDVLPALGSVIARCFLGILAFIFVGEDKPFLRRLFKG